MSYAALATRADAIAQYLLSIGLTVEQPVGVLMARRAELLAVLLGIWKAGGAYVPFDHGDPPDRIRRMQVSSGIELVVGDETLLTPLRAEYDATGSAPPRTVDVGTIPAAPVDAAPLANPAGGARLAYLLFTSGSTGDPKAVEVEHRQALALLQSARDMLQLNESDRYLASSTIAFDASITELFLPLVTGAVVVMRDRGILLDPHRLARDVRRHGITVIQTGPSVWQVMLAEVPDFPRVRVAITHGEAVAPAMAQRIAAQGDVVWNLYGPTETTVWATGSQLHTDNSSSLSTTSAPIGKPLRHVRAVILDEQGNAVPDGTPGELCLGGPSVARGYRNNEQLTREKFISVGGERMYRSGDVVVRDADGVLHYFGRNDDQIKVRGIRVEPGEVEGAILHDPRVAQTAATWFANPNGSRSIVAAVVLQAGAQCRAQDLHDALIARLPRGMIPARFLFVPWLPMTTSGKVDRKVIRKEAEAAAASSSVSTTARETPTAPLHRALTNTELALATIWERMLGLPAVAPDDHFFSIGGDSLAAVQMMVEVETRFGLVLPVHLAFEFPTLESLARRVERAQQKVEDEATPSFVFEIVPSNRGTPMFFSGVELSLARRGLWTLSCPLYAIALWAKGSGFVRQSSLTSLASSHLAAIRAIQPHGPYRLAGFSLGGLIAYEMAQQLRAAGEAVEMLFLLDSMSPYAVLLPGAATPTSTLPEQDHRAPLQVRMAKHLRKVARGPGTSGVSQWLHESLLLDRVAFIDWMHYMATNHYLRNPNAASRWLFPRDRWRAFWFAGRRLVSRYVAAPYDGKVLAVFTNQDRRGAVWKSLLGPGAVRHDVDVPHLKLFDEPMLSQWMAWLADELREEHTVRS